MRKASRQSSSTLSFEPPARVEEPADEVEGDIATFASLEEIQAAYETIIATNNISDEATTIDKVVYGDPNEYIMTGNPIWDEAEQDPKKTSKKERRNTVQAAVMFDMLTHGESRREVLEFDYSREAMAMVAAHTATLAGQPRMTLAQSGMIPYRAQQAAGAIAAHFAMQMASPMSWREFFLMCREDIHPHVTALMLDTELLSTLLGAQHLDVLVQNPRTHPSTLYKMLVFVLGKVLTYLMGFELPDSVDSNKLIRNTVLYIIANFVIDPTQSDDTVVQALKRKLVDTDIRGATFASEFTEDMDQEQAIAMASHVHTRMPGRTSLPEPTQDQKKIMRLVQILLDLTRKTTARKHVQGFATRLLSVLDMKHMNTQSRSADLFRSMNVANPGIEAVADADALMQSIFPPETDEDASAQLFQPLSQAIQQFAVPVRISRMRVSSKDPEVAKNLGRKGIIYDPA